MWHLWTLSMEEHFYFIIPGLVLLAVKRNRVNWLGWLMGAGALGVGIARLFAYTGPWVSDNAPSGIRLAFIQRPDALMIGVVLAILNSKITEEAGERLKKRAFVLGSVGFVVWLAMLNLSSGFIKKIGGPFFEYLPSGVAASAHSEMVHTWYWFRFGHTLGALSFATMLFCLCRYKDWWLTKFFDVALFRWMGRLSYTLYVWHGLAYVIILSATGGDDVSLMVKLARVPVLIAGAFALAIPVFYKVELRVLKMKMKFSSESETLDLSTGKMVATPKDSAS
jgi:peptidoglycan/LPS O-acetylase OafA/YrhL